MRHGCWVGSGLAVFEASLPVVADAILSVVGPWSEHGNRRAPAWGRET